MQIGGLSVAEPNREMTSPNIEFLKPSSTLLLDWHLGIPLMGLGTTRPDQILLFSPECAHGIDLHLDCSNTWP